MPSKKFNKPSIILNTIVLMQGRDKDIFKINNILKNELDSNNFNMLMNNPKYKNNVETYIETGSSTYFQLLLNRVFSSFRSFGKYRFLLIKNSDYIFDSLLSSNGSYYSIIRLNYSIL